jgi:hypothetical protein
MQTEISGILVVLAGMAAMATVDALLKFVDRTDVVARKDEELNVDLIVSSWNMSDEARRGVLAHRDLSNDSNPWDFTSLDLLGIDNQLALAKLRIDIEEALRKAAVYRGIPLRQGRSTVKDLARELTERKVISPHLRSTLESVIAVCNAAVHGREINPEQVLEVLKLGSELVDRLRSKQVLK